MAVDIHANLSVRLYGQEGEVVPVSARLEFRVRPDRKALIERAAELVHEPVSEFARAAAEEKAKRIIREHAATTTVPSEFFDDLIAAFDAPAKSNAALARAAQRSAAQRTRALVSRS